MGAERPPTPAPERERICQALIDLVLERGYERTSVDSVLERAGVGRADFDRHFSGKEDCFAQTFSSHVATAFEARVFGAFERHRDWRDGLRASAYEAARFMRDNPREARFGSIELSAVGPAAEALRERVLQRIVDLLDGGRQELDDPGSMTRAAAEATLGSIYAIGVREVEQGTGGSFESLVPELMYIAVRPYLGEEVAREELTIPPPEESAKSVLGQRGRIRAALIDLVLEHGCEGVGVEMVVERAGLDRAAFDHHFADLDDCLIDAYLVFSGEFDRRVFGSFEAAETWLEGMRAAGYAAARYIREQPREIRFAAVALLAAGPAVQAHRISHVQRLAGLIDRGREQLDDTDSLAPSVAVDLLVTIRERLIEGLRSGDPRKGPDDYVPELMCIAVRPYLGEEVARAELTMPPPAAAKPLPGERERISEAMIDLVLEHGYEATTIEMVLERAGVGRGAFDRLFDGKEHLYLEIFWGVQAVFDRAVAEAFAAHEDWREALRASAYTAARYIRDHPREVRFGVVQMFAAGDLAQVYRERQLHGMVDLIDRGRQELDDPESMSRGVAEGVLGSIYGILIKELQSGAGVSTAESYVPEMMYLAVRPYLGHEVAREELTIPPPPEPGEADD
jgi:AcrR family transcriptional regulator